MSASDRNPDLNVLVALHALLETSSVTSAARQLGTSAPAMSRTLARLRRVYADPLLVRSGRGLVPTPRALELRGEVSALVAHGKALLTPRREIDPLGLVRGFVVDIDDSVRHQLVRPLVGAVRQQAPGVTLSFVSTSPSAAGALREGGIDVQIGVIENADPQTRVERVRTDQLIGVAAADHPLASGKVTVAGYAAAAHISIAGPGTARDPIDDRLALHGRTRRVVARVPDVTTALLAVRCGAAVCAAPESFAETVLPAWGLHSFVIPLPLPEMTISLGWHPRNTLDPAHTWLRTLMRTILTGNDLEAAGY